LLVHGVNGVEKQRHEHLYKLLLVGEHGRPDGPVGLDRHAEALEARMVLQKEEGAVDDRVHVDE
jgi:hypothetical protein